MSIEINKPFPIATTIPIKEAGEGFNEKWLQDQICDNPSILKLGDLEFVTREKTQWKNGRLDILLKNEDEDKMFEVEVMLGETDEKHIIHTIEYWDNEKRKFPLLQHFPVLVAESFDRRFFNIIHLFSQVIPLIAIQVNLVEVARQQSLHFSKIIDTYQPPEESDGKGEKIDEGYWINNAPWTVETAKTLLEIIASIFPNGQLHYTKARIVIVEDGEGYVWIRKRASDKSQIKLWFKEQMLPSAMALLDKAGINSTTKNQEISFITDSKTLKDCANTIVEFAKISKSGYNED
jgi:hypothetical protein